MTICIPFFLTNRMRPVNRKQPAKEGVQGDSHRIYRTLRPLDARRTHRKRHNIQNNPPSLFSVDSCIGRCSPPLIKRSGPAIPGQEHLLSIPPLSLDSYDPTFRAPDDQRRRERKNMRDQRRARKQKNTRIVRFKLPPGEEHQQSGLHNIELRHQKNDEEDVHRRDTGNVPGYRMDDRPVRRFIGELIYYNNNNGKNTDRSHTPTREDKVVLDKRIESSPFWLANKDFDEEDELFDDALCEWPANPNHISLEFESSIKLVPYPIPATRSKSSKHF